MAVLGFLSTSLTANVDEEVCVCGVSLLVLDTRWDRVRYRCSMSKPRRTCICTDRLRYVYLIGLLSGYIFSRQYICSLIFFNGTRQNYFLRKLFDLVSKRNRYSNAICFRKFSFNRPLNISDSLDTRVFRNNYPDAKQSANKINDE